MSRTIHIKGEQGNQVRITVLGRERPGEDDYWDGNWLTSDVEVTVPSFHGAVTGALRAPDIAEFHDQLAELDRTLSGTATFSTLEGWVDVILEGDGRGHVKISGSLMSQPDPRVRMNFDFDSDQTFLADLLSELEEVMREHPTVGEPD